MSRIKEKILLGVNVDHVATLRQARGGIAPDVLSAACLAARSGADSITVHLREDRRHIQDYDVFLIREKCALPLNLEMSLNAKIVEIALQVRPDQVTLVPEKREELTTEGGLNVIKEYTRVCRVVEKFKKKNIRVSLFIDPSIRQIIKSSESGADAIELHTGTYAEAFQKGNARKELIALQQAALDGQKRGLVINAGHGLDTLNVAPICTIPYVHELNIGHSIVARALFVGLEKAVREMKAILSGKKRYAK
jgi:pyridoxine 5-phosphate synthase